jgi:hypothetical protein
VEDPGVFWREMGLRWQVAAGSLLRTIGFRIVRAQHSRMRSDASRPVLHQIPDMDDYLWKYADYIARKDGVLNLIEVKAKPYIPLKFGGRWHELRDNDVSFTEKQKEAFPDAAVPVLILLVHYCDNSSRWGRFKVDPVYYGIIPFRDFQFRPDWAAGILPKPPEELMKRLRNGQASKLLRKVGNIELARLVP